MRCVIVGRKDNYRTQIGHYCPRIGAILFGAVHPLHFAVITTTEPVAQAFGFGVEPSRRHDPAFNETKFSR